MSASNDVEAQLVLWTGGWADLELYMRDELIVETPEFSSVASCLATADALVERLLEPAHSS